MAGDTLTLYLNQSGIAHDTGPKHPETAERLRVLLDLFRTEPFASLPQVQAGHVSMKALLRAHPQRYIESITDNVPDTGRVGLTHDTFLSPGTLDAALEAAGAVCQAVQDVADGKTKHAFCAVRPPGHHAEPSEAMGYCIFNNAFVGARYAQDECGLGRVAIIDFDVHHGNGTDTMARGADDILYISSHQFPLYPMTGHPKHNIPGTVVNGIMASGDGSTAFRRLYTETLLPALEAFQPDLVIISAGFDAHKDDPLANINLDEDDFRWITKELMTIADIYAQGRVVSVLEGGYNLDALRSSVAAHLEMLLK